MIRKNLVVLASLLLVGLASVFTPVEANAAPRFKNIRVRYVGQLPHVRVYVDGTYKTQVRRGSYRDIFLRTGKTYSVRATYAGRSHTQSVYLPRNFRGRYKLVTFSRPSRRGSNMRDSGRNSDDRHHSVTLRIRYNGRNPYARCSINGAAKGKISRNSHRSFSARTGRTYTIRMTFAGKTQTKTVRISRRSGSRVVTFYGP